MIANSNRIELEILPHPLLGAFAFLEPGLPQTHQVTMRGGTIPQEGHCESNSSCEAENSKNLEHEAAQQKKPCRSDKIYKVKNKEIIVDEMGELNLITCTIKKQNFLQFASKRCNGNGVLMPLLQEGTWKHERETASSLQHEKPSVLQLKFKEVNSANSLHELGWHFILTAPRRLYRPMNTLLSVM